MSDSAPMSERSPILAVYGTLRRGEANEQLLADATFLGTGCVDGRLFEMQRSDVRPYRYPSLISSSSGDVVVELYRLGGSATLAAVDALEAYDPADEPGSEYLRVWVAVRDGPVDWAWVYTYNGPSDAIGGSIDDGDWVAHRRRLSAVDVLERTTD